MNQPPVITPAGERRRSLQRRRTAAKAGMGAAMAALVYTGFQRRAQRELHIWAGMALIGFTLWHLALYQPGAQRPPPSPAGAPPRPPAPE